VIVVCTLSLAIPPLPAQHVVILVVLPVLELESSNAQLALPITISIPTLALLVAITCAQMLAQMQLAIVLNVLTPTVRPVLVMSAVPVFPDTIYQLVTIVLLVLILTVILVRTVWMLNVQFARLITLLSMVIACLLLLLLLTLKPEELLPA